MAGSPLTPIFAENFAENLQPIRSFLGKEGKAAFDRLLDRLFEDLVPTLSQLPRSGRAFLDHPVGSLEVRSAIRRVRSRLAPGDDLREFILDEYLILYVIRRPQVIFLAIKHHRQLTFDLHRFWP